MDQGILLVGHGTRSSHGAAEFLTLVGRIKSRFAGWAVEHAFLELREPSIEVGLNRLIDLGVRRLTIAPLLLFAAGHAKRDIPAAVAKVIGGRNEFRTSQAAALGCESNLLELSQFRLAERLDQTSHERTLILFIGRGSYDVDAQAETCRFAAFTQARWPELTVRVAYMAMAEPSVRDAFATAAQEPWEQVIVQPHFLFHGELLEQLRSMTAEAARLAPKTIWKVGSYLAQDIGSGSAAEELLVRAVSERIERSLD